MLSNYFKLALKVLARKKFYTFVSLFGISFTLMVLMLMVGFLDNEFGNHSPISRSDRMLFLGAVTMKLNVPDTSRVVDSVLQDGIMTYDTTLNIGETTRSTSNSEAGFYLLDNYLRDLPHVENYSFYSSGGSFDVYLNSQKLKLDATYTDANYWDVFDYEFVEGRPYRAAEVETASPGVVITEKGRRAYFGEGVKAEGMEMLISGKTYKVLGVIANASRASFRSDIFVPYTHMRPGAIQEKNYLGGFEAAFLANSASEMTAVQGAAQHMIPSIPMLEPDDFNHLEFDLLPFLEQNARSIFFNDEDAIYYFILVLGVILGLFVVVPTLNLININVTRIMERSSEIGVRKAFGAKSTDLLVQFIFENIILTFIGGLIGLLLALLMMKMLNDSQVIAPVRLVFYPSAFGLSILVWFVFGIASGLLPALRMSRLHVVSALKRNEL
ncbi:MAG: ABC transporter permease [Bacteroidota bacterium]